MYGSIVLLDKQINEMKNSRNTGIPPDVSSKDLDNTIETSPDKPLDNFTEQESIIDTRQNMSDIDSPDAVTDSQADDEYTKIALEAYQLLLDAPEYSDADAASKQTWEQTKVDIEYMWNIDPPDTVTDSQADDEYTKTALEARQLLLDAPEYSDTDVASEQIQEQTKVDMEYMLDIDPPDVPSEHLDNIIEISPDKPLANLTEQERIIDTQQNTSDIVPPVAATDSQADNEYTKIAVEAYQLLLDAPEYSDADVSSEQIQELIMADLEYMLSDESDAVPPAARVKALMGITSQKASQRPAEYRCAQLLMAEHQFRFLDSPESTNTVCRFDGRVWVPVSQRWLQAEVMQLLDDEELSAVRSPKSFLNSVLFFLLGFVTIEYQEGVRFTEEDFRLVRNRIVFENCVFDAETGDVLTHDSSLPYERIIHVDYTPEDLPTPTYDHLIRDATGGDIESIKMFDYALGYLAIPNRSGKCLIYMGTAPDSGKTVLAECVANCFKDRAFPLDPENLGSKFAFARAGYAHLYICQDMSEAELTHNAASATKKFVSDEFIRSERKNEQEETVMIRCKLIMISNFPLLIKGRSNDKAFYRRVIVLPFVCSTPLEQIDRGMKDRLTEEMGFIFSKAARSLSEIIDSNGGIQIPESALSVSTKDSWISTPDFVDEFLDMATAQSDNKKDMVSASDLYKQYEAYARISSATIAPCSEAEFKKRVLSKFEKVTLCRYRLGNIKNPILCYRNLLLRECS